MSDMSNEIMIVPPDTYVPVRTMNELSKQEIPIKISEEEDEEEDLLFDEVYRGEVFMANLEDITAGSKYLSRKTRPVVIIQSNKGNANAKTVIVASVTSNTTRVIHDVQYVCTIVDKVDAISNKIMFNQIHTIDKSRLLYRMGCLSEKQLVESTKYLTNSVGLDKIDVTQIHAIEVESCTTRRTRDGANTEYDFKITKLNGKSFNLILPLETLRVFDNSIRKDSNLDNVRDKINNIKGLNFLFNHATY